MAGTTLGETSHIGGSERGSSRSSQETAEDGGPGYFSGKEIEESSPSRTDAIDLKKETYLRKSYCTFLQDLGMRLKVLLNPMATQSKAGKDEKIPQPPANLGEWVVDRYKKVKEDVETYPYVWASYGMVYGGFALWTAYRWRKLRKTEDRVRGLQERLRKLVESEERSKSVQPTREAPPK